MGENCSGADWNGWGRQKGNTLIAICKEEGNELGAHVLITYFNPCGSGTWLITEAEREGDDWRLFGYCYLYEWEWGYLMLSDLQNTQLPFGLTIERDIYSTGKFVRDFLLPEDC